MIRSSSFSPRFSAREGPGRYEVTIRIYYARLWSCDKKFYKERVAETQVGEAGNCRGFPMIVWRSSSNAFLWITTVPQTLSCDTDSIPTYLVQQLFMCGCHGNSPSCLRTHQSLWSSVHSTSDSVLTHFRLNFLISQKVEGVRVLHFSCSPVARLLRFDCAVFLYPRSAIEKKDHKR